METLDRPFGVIAFDCDATAVMSREDSWLLIETGFDRAREHEIESIFAVSNGYLVRLENGARMTAALGEGRPRVLEPGKPPVVGR